MNLVFVDLLIQADCHFAHLLHRGWAVILCMRNYRRNNSIMTVTHGFSRASERLKEPFSHTWCMCGRSGVSTGAGWIAWVV